MNQDNRMKTLTPYLTPDDVRSIVNLPIGHPVRSMVAAASVAVSLSEKMYKFARVTQEVPVFGADLLAEVQATPRGIQCDRSWMLYVTDPITDRPLHIEIVDFWFTQITLVVWLLGHTGHSGRDSFVINISLKTPHLICHIVNHFILPEYHCVQSFNVVPCACMLL